MRAKPLEASHGHKPSLRQTIVYILLSTHLVPCLGTTTLTLLMALISGQRLKLVILLPMVLLGQFVVGWYNDYLDRDRDRIAGRKDKPIAMGLVSTALIGWVAIPSFVISIALGFVYGRAAGWYYLVAMISALLYDYRLKLTPFSIVSLLVSFGLLPVVVAQGGNPATYPHLWMILAGCLLGACVHFLNVIPDFDDDAKTGVKGFVHYFSYRQALFIGATLLMTSVIIVGFSIRSSLNALSIFVLLLMAWYSINFLRYFFTDNLKLAFSNSKKMTLVNITLILCATPFMLG